MEYGKNLSHAYILYSPNEQEAFEEAKRLAAAMLCQDSEKRPCLSCRDCSKVFRDIHPDVITVARPKDSDGKAKKEIVVDQIRTIVSDALILPNEAQKKVYIIKDAAHMNPAAQNALLKILEEPPAFVSFILLAESSGALLETVRSRCMAISLTGQSEEPSAEARELAEKFIAACAKKDAIALLSFCNGCGDMKNAEAEEFAAATVEVLTDMLCKRLPDLKMSRPELMKLVELMEKTRQYLRFNVSTKHIFGMLSVSALKLK